MTAGFPPVLPSPPHSPAQLNPQPLSFHVHPPSPVLPLPLPCLNAHHVMRISSLEPQQQPWHPGLCHRLQQVCCSIPHSKPLLPTTPINSRTRVHFLSRTKVVAKSVLQGGHTTHGLWRVNTMHLRLRDSSPTSTTLQLQRKTISMKKLIRFVVLCFIFIFLDTLKHT